MFSKKITILISVLFLFAAKAALAIPAMQQRCEPNRECIIGEYIFEDDGYTPITTDNFCQITITNPNDVVIVNNQNMPDKNDGWYYYATSTLSSPEGLYRSIICCDSGANRRCLDKSFVLGTSFETLPEKIWNFANRTLTSFGSLVSDIWSNSTRTLTGFGTLVSDIWSNSTRTLTSALLGGGGQLTTQADLNTMKSDLITEINENQTIIETIRISQQKQWTVYLSDAGEVLAGKTYRAKLWILNYESQPTDSYATPTVTIYDSSRNKVVENVSLTKLSTGIYEYTYSIPPSAVSGLWETEVSTEVESGKIIKNNDYWEVEASPAQVKINAITDNTIPSITANVTISNEGTAGYEYQYEYCIVNSIDNQCGGGDDIAYALAAKYINAEESWTTNLTLNVSNTGSYWFKVYVWWGAERSVASQQFTAVEEEVSPPSGGGGGGAVLPSAPPKPVCRGADFSLDGIVDSVDFSIFLYFWKAKPPFKNVCVDINGDKKVDSIDFSILLYQWGKEDTLIKEISYWKLEVSNRN